jgi:RNA polymerase sigma-70 factor (ECF subfamily)
MKDPAVDSPTPSPSVTDWARPEFGAIYSEHSRAIYYLALRFLGDPQRAEDATHDVFLKAFCKFDQFRHQASIRTWLYRIAINHCQNITQSWHERHIQATDDEAVWNGVAAPTESPLRVLEIKELGRRIQKTLDGLSADKELSYEEISALVGQSPDAVRGKLHRARKAFAALFHKTSETSP